MKITRIVFLIIYFALFTYHCLSSLQSASESSELSMGITEIVVKIIESFKQEVKDVDKLHSIVRKVIGHFAYFGLIGLFGFLTYYFFTESLKYTLIFTAISGALMALESELLQFFASERGPSIVDALIDYSGYVLASLALFLIVYIAKQIKKKEMNRVNGAFKELE